MFNTLVSSGHQYRDLMWVYPIALVYEFYYEVIKDVQRDRAFQAHLARISSYSARDLSEKGSKNVEDMWKNFIKPLSEEAAPKQDSQASKIATTNKSAQSLFSVGKFHAVK